MKLIPAIDLKDNKCVRLQKGKEEKSTVYNENPIKQAAILRKPIFSFKIKWLRKVIINGLTKKIAIASAIGINLIAPKNKDVATKMKNALMKWSNISNKLGTYKIFK